MLKNCNLKQFVDVIKQRRLFCFGASQMPMEICEEYEELHIEKKVAFFVDNNPQKKGTFYRLKEESILVLSVEEMKNKILSGDIILITSKYYIDIYEQLKEIAGIKDIDCYIWPMIAPQYKADKELKEKLMRYSYNDSLIPKIIHYFWFGGNPIPDLEQSCIDSWKKKCPDYEIICWNEKNYDISQNLYMKQAYEAKKWGFVPDYARLDIIFQYGGIYLDTDVELIKPLDNLLALKGFAGFESKDLVALGLGFGAKKNHPFIKELRDDYKKRFFVDKQGDYILTASPFLQTEVFEKNGLIKNNKLQYIEDMLVLPAECFSPDNNMVPHITENTYSIHHFSGSWTSQENKVWLQRMREFGNKENE